MESGLDGRNNLSVDRPLGLAPQVSMESGLDGRNNTPPQRLPNRLTRCLNGVRPRWPEQSELLHPLLRQHRAVSMESGLDGRNNPRAPPTDRHPT